MNIDIFDLINKIILLVLSIATVRDVIAYFFPPHKEGGKIYKFIMQSKYERYLLKSTLQDMGYEDETVITNIKKSKSISYERNDKYLEKLIALISEHIIFTKNVKYGQGKESSYYINTMDAIQYEADSNTMIDLMEQLIAQYYKKNKDGIYDIDFIITPKSGNCILGYNYAKKRNRILLVAKNKNDNSYAKYNEGENIESFITNFEGANALIKLAKEKGRSLNGIALDCNCSSGSQLIDAMDYFNQIIKSEQLKKTITPVKEAFVLFRVDFEAASIDEKFKEKNYNLHRYFDLNENIKKLIYNCKGCKEKKPEATLDDCLDGYSRKIDIYTSKGKKCVENIIGELKENKLLKY